MGPGKQKRNSLSNKQENLVLRRFGITQNVQILLKKLQLKQLQTNSKQLKIKLWACSDCNYFSNQPTKFKAHKRRHSSVRPFKCHICKFQTKVKSTFNSHMYTHRQDTMLIPCPFCNYMCRTIRLLNLHLRRHTGEKPYQCPQCDYQCATSCNLTRHVNRLHMKIIPPKTFLCQLCPKKFNNKSQLYAHILRHTGERPFSCQYCETGFTIEAKKQRHENTCKMNPNQRDPTWVESQKPFKCHQCNYSARENHILIRHLETHGVSKRYKCAYEYCDYKTPYQTNLIRHQRYHIGSQPFKCSACSASFASSGELKQHSNPCLRRQDLLHKNHEKTRFSLSMLKPFKCDALDCDKAFRIKGGLRQHLKKVHSDTNKYKCIVPGCRKSFAAKNRFQIHITTHPKLK